jgi:small subunit ribosomal protein S20
VANSKSALKRIQIAERNRLRNKSYKSAVKTFTKKCLQAIEQYTATPSAEAQAEAQKNLSATFSKIDKAVKRGVYPRNTGARKKARLAREFKQATGQVAA